MTCDFSPTTDERAGQRAPDFAVRRRAEWDSRGQGRIRAKNACVTTSRLVEDWRVGATSRCCVSHLLTGAAPSSAASILGLSDTGVLTPGRRADLLAVAGNPLVDIEDITSTRLVMLGGTALAPAIAAAAA